MIGTSGDAPVHLPNPVDWPHCYVIGATRSGKSTLIQVMVHTVMRDAVAVIDPDGRMCSEMVRWREWVGNHRLVYFNPTFKRGMTPCINPLEPVGVDPEDTSERAVHVKQLLAQQLMEALTQVIAGGQGSNVTLPMRSILMPCILTLLYRPGSTLRDLQRFMFRNEAENRDLVRGGQTRYHYPALPAFFSEEFRDARYHVTKGSIVSKLQDLFNTGFFVDLTCGKSTVNLQKCVERRKVMLFNLADGVIGPDASQAIGRLIVALFQGIALRRAEEQYKKHIPIHLFIDECGDYVTDTVRVILQRTGKYELFLTLAQQNAGDRMSQAIRDAVTGNASVLMTTVAKPEHQASAARLLGCRPEDVATLSKGEFLMRAGNSPVVRFRARSDLLGNRNAMSPGAWRRLVVRQLNAYYRPKGQVMGQVEPEPTNQQRAVNNPQQPSQQPDDEITPGAPPPRG